VKGKVIENAKLIEVRAGDGAQCYSWGENPNESLWLCGYNRARGVKVGTVGRLVYRSTQHSGLYWFESYQQ